MRKNLSALALNLRRLREANGYSQKRLGELAGIPWRSIQNAEAGTQDLGADALLALANIFRKTVDDLIRSELGEIAVKAPQKEVTPKEALDVIGKTLKDFQKLSKNPLIKQILALPPDRAKLAEAVLSQPQNVTHIIPDHFKALMRLIPDDHELWDLLLNSNKGDRDAIKQVLRNRIKRRSEILDKKTRANLKHSGSD